MASLKGGVAVGRSPATESMGNVRRELETSWLGVLQCPQCICPLLSLTSPAVIITVLKGTCGPAKNTHHRFRGLHSQAMRSRLLKKKFFHSFSFHESSLM